MPGRNRNHHPTRAGLPLHNARRSEMKSFSSLRTLPGTGANVLKALTSCRWFCLSCQAFSAPTDDSVGEVQQHCEKCGRATLVLRPQRASEPPRHRAAPASADAGFAAMHLAAEQAGEQAGGQAEAASAGLGPMNRGA